MLRKTGKYLASKVTGSVVGKVVKYGFYSLLCLFGPVNVIGVVGISGLAASGIVVHSGIIEYSASKAIEKVL